jgi:hypothetical protein
MTTRILEQTEYLVAGVQRWDARLPSVLRSTSEGAEALYR